MCPLPLHTAGSPIIVLLKAHSELTPQPLLPSFSIRSFVDLFSNIADSILCLYLMVGPIVNALFSWLNDGQLRIKA
ncbi:hypothetical protein BDR04DRAFT_1096684 [Suillus decipiens]|nr:hypothetical protein BDR04DRAFT_1096684 [Suillus decipiens]